ncbi:MAG: hypothetical protein WD335_03765 [Candidatus Paceibacterota bacterium]
MENVPQPKNGSETPEETDEYTSKIQSILHSQGNHEEKIAQIEQIKDKTREEIQKITEKREEIQNLREKFITNDELTEQRKKEYEEAIGIIDKKEAAAYQKIKEAEEAFKKIADTTHAEDV